MKLSTPALYIVSIFLSLATWEIFGKELAIILSIFLGAIVGILHLLRKDEEQNKKAKQLRDEQYDRREADRELRRQKELRDIAAYMAQKRSKPQNPDDLVFAARMGGVADTKKVVKTYKPRKDDEDTPPFSPVPDSAIYEAIRNMEMPEPVTEEVFTGLRGSFGGAGASGGWTPHDARTTSHKYEDSNWHPSPSPTPSPVRDSFVESSHSHHSSHNHSSSSYDSGSSSSSSDSGGGSGGD